MVRTPDLLQRCAVPALVLALLLGAALHAVSATANERIGHDDGISYLAATGHQGEYGRFAWDEEPPYGEWRPAREWKRLTRTEDRFVFGRISEDLSRTDIHPPFYFWVLHVWCLLVGVHAWTGPALNLLIHAATALVVYRVTRFVSGSRRQALAASALLVLSPAVVSAGLHARPYSLFGLWTALTLDQAVRFAEEPFRRAHAAALGILTLIGLLTHYQFVIVAAALPLFLLIRWRQTGSARLLIAFPGLIAAFGGFWLLQPRLAETLARQRVLAQPFELSKLQDRVAAAARSVGEFVVPEFTGPAAWVAAILFCLALAIVAVSLVRRGRTTARFRAVIGSLVLFGLALFGAYLLALTPGHGMGDRYLEPLWPLLAIVTVHGTALLQGRMKHLTTGGIVVAAAIGFGLMSATTLASIADDPASAFTGADCVVIDNVARGALPGIVWHVPDETLLFAASQQDLLSDRGWLEGVGGKTVYVSHIEYQASRAARDTIAELLGTQLSLPVRSQPWGGNTDTFTYAPGL